MAKQSTEMRMMNIYRGGYLLIVSVVGLAVRVKDREMPVRGDSSCLVE